MASQSSKIRVLIAKPGLDGHDRGAKVIARALRDAGMEVIYTGIRQTPQMIVEASAQEDVDVIGLSILSGAHLEIFPEIMRCLREKGMDDVTVLAGGIIPGEDREALLKEGITAVFGPGTSTQEIVEFIRRAMGGENGCLRGPPVASLIRALDCQAWNAGHRNTRVLDRAPQKPLIIMTGIDSFELFVLCTITWPSSSKSL